MIKTADWIIDLGPEGGEEGGQVVATGTPEQVAQVEASHTGRYLRDVLAVGPLERLRRRARVARPTATSGVPCRVSIREVLPAFVPFLPTIRDCS